MVVSWRVMTVLPPGNGAGIVCPCNPSGNRRGMTAPVAVFSMAVLLAVLVQPGFHEGDLALLRGDHILRQLADFRVLAVFQRDFGHVDGALMMRDHAAHEVD